MAFSWKTFFLDLAEVGPAAIEIALGLKAEVPAVTRTQLATDSLHAATGIAAVVDPKDAPAIAAAQNIVQSYITAASGGQLGNPSATPAQP